MKKVFLIFLLSLFAPLALANASCIDLLTKNINSITAEQENAFIEKIRKGFDPKEGPGYVILDTESLFPEELANEAHAQVMEMRLKMETPLPSSNAGNVGAFLDRYGNYVQGLINQALQRDYNSKIASNKPFEAYKMEVFTKHSTIYAQKKQPVRRDAIQPHWHTDDTFIQATVTLKGTGTVYIVVDESGNSKAIEVPRGKTFLFTGGERVKFYKSKGINKVATIEHGSPTYNEDRLTGIFWYYLEIKIDPLTGEPIL